jgi:hypothetical protein
MVNNFKSYNKVMQVVFLIFFIALALSFILPSLRSGKAISIFPIIILAGLFLLRGKMSGQATKALEVGDQKIKEFQNKNFASFEEKEKAKQELKVELVALKNQIHFIRGRRDMDDKIMLL